MNSILSMVGIEDYVSGAGNYVTLFQLLLDAMITQVKDGTDAVTREMCPDWILEATTSGTTTASFDKTTTYSTVPYNGCEPPSTDPNDERWTNYNASLYFFGGSIDPNAYPPHAPIVADISNSTRTMISIDCDFL
ncbi:hypothetical protein WR25_05238 [Diploscapter pachys]|uniref:Uncharacterized protein n=1 Tax=Diploscapter pachys TaxID=2018661 RepID=A0A2A2L7X3_9BILA|nr:hypothetical protein WR25_05238 [Diploscapter pachys]